MGTDGSASAGPDGRGKRAIVTSCPGIGAGSPLLGRGRSRRPRFDGRDARAGPSRTNLFITGLGTEALLRLAIDRVRPLKLIPRSADCRESSVEDAACGRR